MILVLAWGLYLVFDKGQPPEFVSGGSSPSRPICQESILLS